MSNDIKNQINKIVNHYNLGDYNKVIELSKIFIKKFPESDFVMNIMSLSFQKIGKFDQAEKLLMLAHEINVDNLSVINNIANNFKYKLDFKNAEKFYLIVLEKEPYNTSALLNFGNLKFTLNKNEEALELLLKALETNDKLIPIHLNLAIVYQSLGNFKKAIEHLKTINEIDPKFTRADKMLSVLINYNDDDKHLLDMENKLKKKDLTDNQEIYLYFGISKGYEDLKNYKKAFNYISLGNKLKRKNLSYKIENDQMLFNQIKNFFKDYNFDENINHKKEINPIFILGMPRSGTTLVEQIISSHKKVDGLGELNFFNKIAEHEFLIKDLFKASMNEQFQQNIISINTKYYDLIEHFDLKNTKFTDKTLLNFFWVGVIKMCFPNAKVINCLRKPKDNCLSIYKNLFDYEGAWCYNEKELIEYFKLYQNAIKFWIGKINNFIYNVEYEKLIQNPKAEIKKMVNFCDLEWDENCLNFHNNKSAIKTLSVNQARKKIYSSSLNSYENYKSFSKDLFKEI
tara:strand:+ start:117 stop:1658 length:1542 start_codon:yes stop_codon:yes gene_type:complete